METLFLVVLHIAALVWLPMALFVTLPLHIIYDVLNKRSRDARAADVRSRESTAATLRTCPRCAEQIQRAAVVCRYCGAEITAAPP